MQQIPHGIGLLNSYGHWLIWRNGALDNSQVQFIADDILVAMYRQFAIFRRKWIATGTIDGFFVGHTVLNQISNGAHF